jgi:transcriptional antiterminator RfaH
MSKPRQEAYARTKLLEQGFEVYLPQLERWARRGGDWQRSTAVMFPRYVFFRAARPGQSPSPAASTPGVSNLVRFGQVLATMPGGTMLALQQLVAQQAAGLSAQPLQPGAAVVFCEGPLKGAQGIVSEVASERVRVMLSLLGREASVLVHPRSLVAA